MGSDFSASCFSLYIYFKYFKAFWGEGRKCQTDNLKNDSYYLMSSEFLCFNSLIWLFPSFPSVLLFSFFFFGFWDRASLCSLGWLGTCYVDQALWTHRYLSAGIKGLDHICRSNYFPFILFKIISINMTKIIIKIMLSDKTR